MKLAKPPLKETFSAMAARYKEEQEIMNAKKQGGNAVYLEIDPQKYRRIAAEGHPISAVTHLMQDIGMHSWGFKFHENSDESGQRPVKVSVKGVELLIDRGEAGAQPLNLVGQGKTADEAYADLLETFLNPSGVVEPLFGKCKAALIVNQYRQEAPQTMVLIARNKSSTPPPPGVELISTPVPGGNRSSTPPHGIPAVGKRPTSPPPPGPGTPGGKPRK